MAVQDDKTLLCKGDLKAYHESISPYLGGNFMLDTNVSDYYSTDEKIVGVWIDGKPVYQRIVSFLNTTTDFSTHVKICEVSSWNIDNLIFLYGATNNHSSVNQIAVPIGYNTAENDKRIFYICKQDVPNIRENGIWTRGTAVGSLTIIVQYTKTTDAANSAIATPGCYDINFPNTWPENKEIFFGNGAYGYRATGTFNTTIDTRESTLLLSLTRTSTTKLISQGGTIKRSVISPTSSDITIGGPFVSYNLTNGIVSTPFYAVSIESDGIKLWRRDTTMSNVPYDLWFTYTK